MIAEYLDIPTRVQKKNAIAPRIIAVAASMGGPDALAEFLKALPKDLMQPVVVVQHVPHDFTAIFIDHLRIQTQLDIVQAQDGMLVEPRHVYVAPGNRHMIFDESDRTCVIRLTDEAPFRFCKPSANLMIDSLRNIYGERVLAVILSGMGSDGLEACIDLFNAGGTVVAQDKITSTAWGMPGAVAHVGICAAIGKPKNLSAFVTVRASL